MSQVRGAYLLSMSFANSLSRAISDSTKRMPQNLGGLESWSGERFQHQKPRQKKPFDCDRGLKRKQCDRMNL